MINLSKIYPTLHRTIISILYKISKNNNTYLINDFDIYNGICRCLAIIKASSIIIKFGHNNILQYCLCIDMDHILFEKNIKYNLSHNNKTIMTNFNDYKSINISIPGEENNFNDIISIIFHNKNCNEWIDNIYISSDDWYPVASIFREVFRQRNQSLKHFSNHFIMKTWENIENKWPKKPNEFFINTINTITVALDLRKSTFAMEQSKDDESFSLWMKNTICKLTEISKHHCAVFDKFTGDGLIIHFFCDDEKGNIKSVMQKAILCSADMIKEVESRLVDLRKILYNDSGRFGAGVGIAVGKAHWGIDHTGNPLVAPCGAGPGKIHLTNLAYQEVKETQRGQCIPADSLPFENKDFPLELEVKIFQIDAQRVRAQART